MAIAVFTIATLYWKHYYPAYLVHCQNLDMELGGMFKDRDLSQFSFVRFCIPSLVVHWTADILFWGALLYYLTRSSVKNYFQEPHEK